MKRIIILLITVYFALGCSMTDSAATYTLSTSVSPAEAGTISPAKGEFDEFDLVSVQAIPNDGYVFFEWSGDISDSDNPVSIEIRGDVTLHAQFKTYEEAVTYTHEGYISYDEKVESMGFETQ